MPGIRTSRCPQAETVKLTLPPRFSCTIPAGLHGHLKWASAPAALPAPSICLLSGSERDVDCLQFRARLDALPRLFAADARVLVAAEGQGSRSGRVMKIATCSARRICNSVAVWPIKRIQLEVWGSVG